MNTSKNVKKPLVRMNVATKLRLEKAHPLERYIKEIEMLKSQLNESNANNTLRNENNQKLNKSVVKLPKKDFISLNKNMANVKKDVNLNRTTSSIYKTLPKSTGNNKLNNTMSNKSTSSIRPPEKSNSNLKSTFNNRPLTKPPIFQSKSTNLPTKSTAPKPIQKQSISHTTISKLSQPKTYVSNQPVSKAPPTKKPNQKPIRRSISAVHLHRIQETDPNKFIKQNSIVKKVEFKTPKNDKFLTRRSLSCSPMSVQKDRTSNMKINNPPIHLVKNINGLDMKNQLNKWLEQKGKPLGSYHHLKCFGIHILPSLTEFDEEDKENYEEVNLKTQSYEDLKIASEENDKKISEKKDLFGVAKEALNDLHKLILENYSRESCETWLQLIKSKFTQLEEQPLYWECRAALEEARGNFSSAVDCYQKAIIKGAEVKGVDNSLDQLLEKFAVLNLSPEKKNGGNQTDKHKRKTIVDARNVFKSSIINFAIQKRKNDNEDPNYSFDFVATPVRRSTRNNRKSFTSTPTIQLCTSLNQLEQSTRDSLLFRNNKALAM